MAADRCRMNSSSSSSPSRSSISTTAVVGGSTSNAMLLADDFQFPLDLISTQDRKDEAMLVLKSDLLAALNKEVKSLDEDSWKFEGPRSRIHLVSRPGGFLTKRLELTKNTNSAPPRK